MEAAGYDVVLVETVGVGQSETTVAEMVDSFLFLTLARTGDQLQGIKKGVLELADVIAVNKADGQHAMEAKRAARELSGALRLLRSDERSRAIPVLTCSAKEGTGLDEVWEKLVEHQERLRESGELEARRRRRRSGGRGLWCATGSCPTCTGTRASGDGARAGAGGRRGDPDARARRRAHPGGVLAGPLSPVPGVRNHGLTRVAVAADGDRVQKSDGRHRAR